MKTSIGEVSAKANAREACVKADRPAEVSAVPLPRLQFAPMGETDLAAVLAIERSIYRFPWTPGNFRDSLTAGYSSWICRENGQPVGYAVMMVVLEDAHLLNITILAQHQGRGLGSELLSHLFDVARGHGAKHMFLEVRPSNRSGHVFYRRFLFAEIGRRKGYYPAPDGREEAVVMAREL
jgi:ribosomal-protein-alanine N-acetyltransferase